MPRDEDIIPINSPKENNSVPETNQEDNFVPDILDEVKESKGYFPKYSLPDVGILKVIDNPQPDRNYHAIHSTREFTSLCPESGLPDFAEIIIDMVPDEVCVELKSLKYYLLAFRQHRVYMEEAVNQILNDLVEVCVPKFVRVVGNFGIRGGIETTVVAEYDSEDDEEYEN